MPDFGIMRGFNEKLFGDKLVAGQLPTQLGLIGSQEVFDTDADAQAFFDRVTAAGGTLSATEKTAVDTFVKQMKADGIWTKMKAIYPMVGASAAACSRNLKADEFNGTFSSGWTFASTGVTPVNAFMNTGLNASTNLSVTSLNFGGYTKTDINSGGFNGATPPVYFMMGFVSFFAAAYWRTNATNITTSPALGMIQANQLGTLSSIFKNNALAVTDNVTMTSLPNLNMYIGAVNNDSNATFFDNKELSYFYFSDGMNETELSKHYTAVQAFQTTLSRQA
jgi:hypothetical protein